MSRPRRWHERAVCVALVSLGAGCGGDAGVMAGAMSAPTNTPATPVAGKTSSEPPAAQGGSAAPSGTAGNTGARTALAGAGGVSAGGAAGAIAGMSAEAVTPAAVGGAGGAGAAGVGGSGGALGAAGAAAGSGGAAAGAGSSAMHEDLGKGDGHDVVMLGDSYMSNTLQFEGTGGGIVPSLLQATGQRYRNYAVQGTMLLMDDSYGPAIPTQWDDAKRANADIKTVIMTGGGNDIIQSTSLKQACMTGGDDCKQLLLKETKRFDELWSAMAEAGVKDVVRIGYTTSTGTVDSKILNDPDVTAAPSICSSGKIRCHMLATTDLIMNQLAGDGIHPLQAANDRVAKAVAELMQSEGMRR